MKKFLISAAALVCTFALAACGHTHEFSEKWTTDETHHWKACSGDCTEVASRAEHDWGEPETVEPTEETEGSKTYTCKVCGAEKVEKIDKLPPHECYFAAEWVSDADSHWHACTAKEGCTKRGSATAHLWGEPVVTKKPTVDTEGEKQSICSECGRTKTENIAKLPPKMSESDWKALFAFKNLKVTGEMTMGSFGSSNVVYLIDGDKVHEIIDGETSAVGRDILIEMDLSAYHAKFDNMGNGLYVAEEVVIEDDLYGGMKLQNVNVHIKQGQVTKVDYTMDVLGVVCNIVYEFSDYGKVKIESSMTREEWEAAFSLENVTIGTTVTVGDLDPQYITYYVNGETVLALSGTEEIQTDRTALVEMDLSDYYDKFTDLGGGRFGSPSFTLNAEGYEEMVFDVNVKFDSNGLPETITYETVTEGVYILVEYVFYDWGKVSFEKSMTREEWEAAFALENVRANGYIAIVVNDIIQQENEFCYYIKGDRVKIEDDGEITYSDRGVLYDFDFGKNYDDFIEMSPGVFEADAVQVYVEDTYDVFYDVTVITDSQGHPQSLSYVWYYGEEILLVEYTFDMWGNVDI